MNVPIMAFVILIIKAAFVIMDMVGKIVHCSVKTSVHCMGIFKKYFYIFFRKCDFETLTCSCRLGFGLDDCSSSCESLCKGRGNKFNLGNCNYET